MANNDDHQAAPSAAPTATKPDPSTKPKVKNLPPWNVILLNDDDHSYEYVIEMLGVVAAIPVEKAFQMAKEVDSSGRVIVLTTHREKAELKQEQIHSYGVDLRITRCKGSMSSVIEPAEA